MSDVAILPEHRDRQAPHPSLTICVGAMPWFAAWCGSYLLHSAVASFLLYHSLCFSAALIYRARFGPRSSKPFPRHHWLALAGGCLAGCFVVYLTIGFVGALTDPARVLMGLRLQHIPLDKESYVLLFAYFAIVNPIAEEFFWRGTIYSGLRRRHLHIRACSNIDAVLFGSWHWLIVRLFFSPLMALVITVGIVFVGEIFCRFY